MDGLGALSRPPAIEPLFQENQCIIGSKGQQPTSRLRLLRAKPYLSPLTPVMAQVFSATLIHSRTCGASELEGLRFDFRFVGRHRGADNAGHSAAEH
jgi:hypothetical protein